MPSPSCSGENRGAAHRGEAAVGANLGWWEQRAQGPGTDTEMCQGLRTLHPMREEQGGGHSSSVQMVSASCSLQGGPVGQRGLHGPRPCQGWAWDGCPRAEPLWEEVQEQFGATGVEDPVCPAGVWAFVHKGRVATTMTFQKALVLPFLDAVMFILVYEMLHCWPRRRLFQTILCPWLLGCSNEGLLFLERFWLVIKENTQKHL